MKLRDVKTISVSDLISKKKEFILIDTRTPKEYEFATVPGSHNVPIFTNDERAIIGTIYHKKSQKEAFDTGVEIALKKIDDILNQIKSIIKTENAKQKSGVGNKKIVVFCWRGGMRSKGVVNILEEQGIDAFQLEGGHKAYRRFVLDRFSDYKPSFLLIVLNGLTGTGKTEILRELINKGNKNVIDLEGLARHRSSVLGSIGLNPRSQVMFDSLLFENILELENEKVVFIEGESRKVGKVSIPDFLYNLMKCAVNVKVYCTDKQRIKRLMDDYFVDDDKAMSDFKQKLYFFEKKLGKKKVTDLILMINQKEYEKVAEILLHKYYDELYSHTLNKIDYSFEVNSENVSEATLQLIGFSKKFQA